jgi:hypothetical protein
MFKGLVKREMIVVWKRERFECIRAKKWGLNRSRYGRRVSFFEDDVLSKVDVKVENGRTPCESN